MAGEIEIGLLGPARVTVQGRPLDLPGARLPALLAALAVVAPHPVTVERLAEAVWGEGSAVDARPNVHSNVRRLRRLLGVGVIATHGAAYALDVKPDQVDAVRFVHLLHAAAAAPDRATEHARLVDALALWRGDPFHGIRSDWLQRTQAERLRERYLSALQRRIELDLATGTQADLAPVLGELRELTGRHPLRESVWALLLVGLQRCGRAAEALAEYETLRRRLADELGADPGPELQRVHATLLGLGAPEPPPRAVPRQLPADVAAFAGRAAAMGTLDALLTGGGSVARQLVVIAGTAGVGKTSLALRWAHRVADRFPDGQLYVNLRGFDPSGSPLAPAEALHGFLEALRVPAQRIPAAPEARAAMYRSLLAGTRTLVVLDNARDAGQVAPLLPGAHGCLAVVTSRNELPGLLASTGALPLALGVLGHDEAVQLFGRRLGPGRVATEPDATRELVERCAGLPLALAVVAARAAAHPEFRLADVARELRETHGALDGFDTGDAATDARTVFSWSYDGLDAAAARLFRLLAGHPGPDITVPAAASLAGCPLAEVRRLLVQLTRAHLLTEPAPGRFTCHDLLRAYAGELTQAHDSAGERQAATRRMLDHYLHTARAADLLLYPHGEVVDLPAARSGVTLERLADEVQALAWFRAEHHVLLGAIHLAADGYPQHAHLLAGAMGVVLHRQGRWHDRIATQHIALAAARRLGTPDVQSRAHRELGVASADLGRFDDAHVHLDNALRLAAAAGDVTAQAWAHHYRDLVFGQQGRDGAALDAAQQALRLFRMAGDRMGQAIALSDVGWYHGRLGNHEEAVRSCTLALAEHRELGNRSYEAHTRACLGDTHHRRGDIAAAVDGYEHALALFREVGDRYGEASTLARLGELHDLTGHPEPARACRDLARAILGELDPPAARHIRAGLQSSGTSSVLGPGIGQFP